MNYLIAQCRSVEKGKPVEKQGRKVSDLRGKSYGGGAAKTGFWPPFHLT